MRLLFRMRTGSGGLLEDKKSCRMASDERCVMCDSGVGEDVAHFLVGCGQFERYQLVLLDDVCRTVWVREWLDEFCHVDEEGMMALLLGKGWRAHVTERWRLWESAYCIGWVDVGREGSNYCMGRLLLDIGPPLSCHLSPSLNSWTQYNYSF